MDDNLPNEFKFPSLKHAGRMYRVYRSRSYDRVISHDPIGTWATAYETYGHGEVQHSHEWAVQRESFEDWCASLATHLLAHRDLVPIIAYHAGHVDHDEAIEFAMKLKYDPEKEYPRLRYCLEERKSSRSDKYRHDRRWEEVHQYIDGTLAGCCRVLNFSTSYDLFSMIYRWVHLRRRYEALKHCDLGPDAPAFKEWFKLDGADPHVAFMVLVRLIEAHQALNSAERCMRNWHAEVENVERRRQQALAKTAVAVS